MNLCLSVVDAVGRILTRECVRPRTPKNAICPSSGLPATLKANDQDQPVAATDLTCEKPPTATRLHLIVMSQSTCQIGFNRGHAIIVLLQFHSFDGTLKAAFRAVHHFTIREISRSRSCSSRCAYHNLTLSSQSGESSERSHAAERRD